jgi:hypothetical protein
LTQVASARRAVDAAAADLPALVRWAALRQRRFRRISSGWLISMIPSP